MPDVFKLLFVEQCSRLLNRKCVTDGTEGQGEKPARFERREFGPRKIQHRVVLRSAEDLDTRLMGWLKGAYRLNLGERCQVVGI